MVSSAPTIMQPRVRIPSKFFSNFIVEIETIIDKWETDENKQKEAGIGPSFKKQKIKTFFWTVNFQFTILCIITFCRRQLVVERQKFPSTF